MAKILVAEDELRIRSLLADLLTDSGHEVLQAANGGSALEQACSELPDLILLDVMMPVMDGFEVLMGLRENSATEETPVVMLTALDAEDGEVTGISLGVEHYITKPVIPEVVEAAVRLALRNSGTANAPVKMGNKILDSKLGGGIQPGSLMLIEGASSAGKSVLCQHLIHGALELGHGVACFTSEDSLRSLVFQMGSMGLSVSNFISSGKLNIFPMHEIGPKDNGGELLSSLATQLEEIPDESKLITVDSITDLASISEEHAISGFFSHCKRICSSKKTIVIVVHSFALDEKMLIRLRTLCDAHLKLTVETIAEKPVMVMEVCKINNANQNTGNLVSFEVEPGLGMKVIPIFKAKA